jgi:excisionase family DNA binding protein
MSEEQFQHHLEPILLRIDPDVTRLTRLGRSTIYQEIAAGRLRAVKIGRSVRVRRDDLEAWLDRHTRGGDDSEAT